MAGEPITLRSAVGAPPAEPLSPISAAPRIARTLADAGAPFGVRQLRALCRIRGETVCATLDVDRLRLAVACLPLYVLLPWLLRIP